MVHSRVYLALGRPLIGHLDPEFLTLMDSVQDGLRRLFRTANPLTIAISGTGSAGMEASLVNFIEPGDEVLVCINGVFGTRMADIAARAGGRVHRLERPWGEVFDLEEVQGALRRWPQIRQVAIVHAETSTGALQPLQEIGSLCRQRDLLFLVDAVTSLGGIDLRIDEWCIDVCYSGTQKCLSCPPGLAPLTAGPRALEKLERRRSKVNSWYLDLSLIQSYWSERQRTYHHTAPISMNFALDEALRIIFEEGLEDRFQRHALHSRALLAGLEALGCEPFAQAGHRLPMLNAVRLPPGVEDLPVRHALRDRFGIEIGGGLGPLAGRIWRIGLMGESARRANVLLLLGALEEILAETDSKARGKVATRAAEHIYAS